MTRDDIDKFWNQAIDESIAAGEKFTRYSFVELLEREMIRDGWRQCAKGQKTTQFCGQIEAAVAAEREACAKKAERWDAFHPDSNYGHCIAKLIRERWET